MLGEVRAASTAAVDAVAAQVDLEHFAHPGDQLDSQVGPASSPTVMTYVRKRLLAASLGLVVVLPSFAETSLKLTIVFVFPRKARRRMSGGSVVLFMACLACTACSSIYMYTYHRPSADALLLQWAASGVPSLRLRGGKRSGMYSARQSKRLVAAHEARSSTPDLAHALAKRRKGGPGAAAIAKSRAEARLTIEKEVGGGVDDEVHDRSFGSEGVSVAERGWVDGETLAKPSKRFGWDSDFSLEEGESWGVGRTEGPKGATEFGPGKGVDERVGETGGGCLGKGGMESLSDTDEDRIEQGVVSRNPARARQRQRSITMQESGSEEAEEEEDEEAETQEDEEEDGGEGYAVEGDEPLPQRRLRPWERDSEMEEPLVSADAGDASDLRHDPLPHVRAINFTFDVDEVTEQIKVEEAQKRAADRQAKIDRQIQAMQKPGAWSIAGSACEEWDWFQGRSKDTFDYSTFRHRKYGYVVQLYDQTNGAWISFSRMAQTQVTYTCLSNGLTETRRDFWGSDLVNALVNLTVVQKRRMPFRALADGDPVVFRHSYWHGQVLGGSVVIRHLKKTDLALHLTPEGFVFVGQPTVLQVPPASTPITPLRKF